MKKDSYLNSIHRYSSKNTIVRSMVCFLLICLSYVDSSAQIGFPPDSLFHPGKVIVTLHHNAVDPNYYCNPTAPGKTSSSDAGLITPSSNLITDSDLLQTLTQTGSYLEPFWAPCLTDCPEDGLEQVSYWGDTLKIPYWTRYIVHFPTSYSPVQYAFNLLYNHHTVVHSARPLSLTPTYGFRGTPNDPLFGNQLSLRPPSNFGINIEEAWDITPGSWDICIAAIDGYLNTNHEDFHDYSGATNVTVNAHQAVYGNPAPNHYHGTFVAGIMAAMRNNKNSNNQFIGISGVAGGDWSNGIKGCKYHHAATTLRDEELVEAISDLTASNGECDKRVRVINMSFGNAGHQPIEVTDFTFESVFEWYQSLAIAYRLGVVLVGAKNEEPFYNENTDPIPGEWKYDTPTGFNDQWMIGVGASRGNNGALAYWSSYGGNIDILAPGTHSHVYSLLVQSGYDYDAGLPAQFIDGGGTSWSAPHVSGAAGLLLSHNPDLLNDDVSGLIQATAKPTSYYASQSYSALLKFQDIPFDEHTGYGILNIGAAMNRAYDVKYGVVDLSTWDIDQAIQDGFLEITAVDDDFEVMHVVPTETDDPFLGMEDGYEYAWKRFKIKVIVAIPDQEYLEHAWGIGCGHGIVPDTKGWDPGFVAIYKPKNVQPTPLRWCSETPYAKVVDVNDYITGSDHYFAIETYVWHLRKIDIANNTETLTYYPTNPENVSISYGYLAGNKIVDVMDETDKPGLLNNKVSIFPNPIVGMGSLIVSIEFPGKYRMCITDILGNKLFERQLGILESGVRTLSVDFGDLSTGMYYCHLLCDDRSVGTISTSFTAR